MPTSPSHDSRSRTIGQTPSRHFPVETTEVLANEPSLRQLLDGLRWQMHQDRKQQKLLRDKITKVKKSLAQIQKQQDKYLDHIYRALAQVEHVQENDEDENETSQESQTQLYDYNQGNEDFRALSDVEDSVLPGSTQRDESQGLFVPEQSHHIPEAASPLRSAVEIARSRTSDHDGRESVDRHATSLLATFDGFTRDHERGAEVAPEASSSEIDSTSRMATPITPGMTRTLLRTSVQKKKTPPAVVVTSAANATASVTPASPPSEPSDVELPSVNELLTPAPQAQMTIPQAQTTVSRAPPTPTAPRTSTSSAPRTPAAPRTPQAPSSDTFQRTMQPPSSRPKKTPSTKNSKRKRDESVDFIPSSFSSESSTFTPTASAEPRAKRMAASVGQARNTKYFAFKSLSPREASQAFQDETRSPFINCGGCGKASCQMCEETRQIREKAVWRE